MRHGFHISGDGRFARVSGAEFVKQLCARDHRVLAAMRDPARATPRAAGGERVVQLDVDRPETFDAFAAIARPARWTCS